MNEIDKLAWLYLKNKQLLGARSKGKNTYYIPGGKREEGETDHQALLREIKEELSVDLIPLTITYAGTFKAQAHDKPHGTLVKISGYFAEFIGEIKPDTEIAEVCWLPYQDKEHCSLVTQIIMEWLKAEELLE